MRAVIQKVLKSTVRVEDVIVGEIAQGFLVLLGVCHDDTIEEAKYLANKIATMRIFEDDAGKMNLSLADIGGEILSVSQFTLYGDMKKGRRPSFTDAAAPMEANALYEAFNAFLRGQGISVETGTFQSHMQVELVNDGPATFILDTDGLKGEGKC